VLRGSEKVREAASGGGGRDGGGAARLRSSCVCTYVCMYVCIWTFQREAVMSMTTHVRIQLFEHVTACAPQLRISTWENHTSGGIYVEAQ
jgi:hypothetical protein